MLRWNRACDHPPCEVRRVFSFFTSACDLSSPVVEPVLIDRCIQLDRLEQPRGIAREDRDPVRRRLQVIFQVACDPLEVLVEADAIG